MASVINMSNLLTITYAFVKGTSKIEYIGEAQPGTGKGVSKWRIRKNTWSGMTITDTKWASGTNNFKYEWDERAG